MSNKAWSAPGQQQMGSVAAINVAESMYLDWAGEGGKESLVADHVPLAEIAKKMCFPLFFNYVPWRGNRHQLVFKRECSGCCSFPYSVYVNGNRKGGVQDVGCCDNGCYFCMCPCVNCTGHVKMVSMEDAGGNEKFVFAKGLFPCWPCVQVFAMACAPIGVCCISIKGCHQYCSGEEFMTITQPVYAGPWKRSDGSEPTQIGEINTAFRFRPVSLCCAVPTILKVYYKATTDDGNKIAATNLELFSTVLAMYRGMEPPCKIGCMDFQQPTGVSCLDIGLGTKVEWKSLASVQKESA